MALLIRDIRTDILRIPLKRPIADSTHQLHCLDLVYVRVITDAGPEGHSFMLSFDYGTGLMKALMDQEVKRHVVGKDALQIEALGDQLNAQFEYFGNTGLAAWGIAALDIALWDVKSKFFAIPLQVLLGGRHKSLPVYGSGGWLSYSTEMLVEEALRYKTAGFKGVKMKIGHDDIRIDVARVKAVREALGFEIDLMVDANQGWYIDQALAFCRAAADLRLDWLEEPLRLDDKKNLALLRRKIDIPVAVGEREYGVAPFRELMLAQAADIVQPDILRVGGLTKFMQVARLAGAFNVRVASHFYKETDIFALSALGNAKYLEYFDWFDDLFIRRFTVVDGLAPVPETPGMHLEIRPDAVKEYAIT